MFEEYNHDWEFVNFIRKQNNVFHRENIKDIFNKIKLFQFEIRNLQNENIHVLLTMYITENLDEIYNEGNNEFIEDILIEILYNQRDFKRLSEFINSADRRFQQDRRISYLHIGRNDNEVINMIENMNINSFNKIKLLAPFTNTIIEYIKNHYDELEIMQNYEKILDEFYIPHIFNFIHHKYDINNDILHEYFNNNKKNIWRRWDILIKHGFDLLRHKNEILNKIILKKITFDRYDLIKYLLENNAVADKNERKLYKSDSKLIIKLLEEHGIKSI
jgi:hypothetical protein